jgi:hypothetical protein
MAVCSEIHTKHINTLCGQNVELLNVKPDGKCSNHWALKGQKTVFLCSGLLTSSMYLVIYETKLHMNII